MNLIYFLTILSTIGYIKCDLPKIKVDIAENEDGFMLVTKVLFAKLDWMMVEIDKITKRLNQQDENIKQLLSKAEVSEVVKTDVTELKQQLFQKIDLQEKLITKSSNDIERFNMTINEMFENQSLSFQKSSDDMDSVNATLNEMFENLPLLFQKSFNDMKSFNVTINKMLHNQLLDLHDKFLTKSTESIYKMLPNRTINGMVILRRQDGFENFDRNWLDYKNGFGNPNGDFFIGLDKLHAITTNGERQELLVILRDFDNNTRYAKYDHFVVGNEEEKYELKKLGNFSGDAGDSMVWHLNLKFSTNDQNNDKTGSNCAKGYEGGWWFHDCYSTHLTGPYYHKPTLNKNKGIIWSSWHGHNYSLSFAEMLLRPNP